MAVRVGVTVTVDAAVVARAVGERDEHLAGVRVHGHPLGAMQTAFMRGDARSVRCAWTYLHLLEAIGPMPMLSQTPDAQYCAVAGVHVLPGP